MRLFKILLCLTCVQSQVQAQQVPATHFADPASAASSVSPVAGVAQSLFGLVLVLCVLFAVVWLLRRFKMVGQTGAADLRVIQGISLGAKERAVLIQVHGRHLLLGVAPGQVTLLSEVSVSNKPVYSADDSSDHVAGKPLTQNFKDILKRSLGMQGGDPS